MEKKAIFCSTSFLLHNVVSFWQGSIIKLNSLFALHPPIADLKENSKALSLASNEQWALFQQEEMSCFERVVEESAKCSNFSWNKYLNDSHLAHPLRCQCRLCTPGLYKILVGVDRGAKNPILQIRKDRDTIAWKFFTFNTLQKQ